LITAEPDDFKASEITTASLFPCSAATRVVFHTVSSERTCLPALPELRRHWLKPSAQSEWLVSLGDGVM